MSNKAITWAYAQTETKHMEKFVLVALADMADQDHSCFPTKKVLSSMTGLAWNPKTGDGQVNKHIASLKEKGFITIEARRRKDGGQGSSRYYLQLDREEITPGAETTPGVESTPEPPAESTPEPGVETTPRNKNPQENPQENPQGKTTSETAVAATDLSMGERFAEALCQVLIDALKANGSKVPEKITKKWLDAARLMIDADGRDPHQARELILWATSDTSFWQANILSLPKFREKYDQLRLTASRRLGSGKPTVRESAAAAHDELLRRQAASDQKGISE